MPDRNVTVAEIETYIDTEARTWQHIADTTTGSDAVYADGRVAALDDVARFIQQPRGGAK